jgi:acyl-coenzyme A synthetase/AMP-(fatty) acid ligase
MADLPLLLHDPAAAFAFREKTLVPAGDFLAEAAALAARLPDRRYVINLCADRLCFATAFAAAMLRGQVSLMPPNQTPNTIDRLLRDYPGSYCLDDALVVHESRALTQSLQISKDQIAAITFTSGSTGEPMPHPKTWGGLVEAARAEIEALGIAGLSGLSVLGTVPPQHMYGLESTVLMAMQGPFAMHAGRPFFPADICAELAAFPAPRALVTTPVHLRALLAETSALPALEFVLSATAPLSMQLAAEAEACFAAPLLEIYGCTEAGQMATRRPTLTEEWTLLPQFTLRQDARGTWVKGGHARAELLLSDVIELRGGRRFVLHGRTADLVNIAGKRTSLASLNHHLNSIPGVRDGAFVAPEEVDGSVTRLAAFAVAPGLSSEAILAALRERIDPAFLPRPLCLVDALPRNETGKLPRSRLDALMAKTA